MDSLTQFVLGAAVGVAVLGRRLGPRRAAITGGLIGILPDLDILVPAADTVDAFVSHRGFSHSLVVQAAVTPLIGEGMVRFIAALRRQRLQTYAAVYLCLATHALLDGLTVYGTKLLWPLSMEPYAVGSIFIIDILYTLPLLVATVWALFLPQWSGRSPRMGTVIAAALVLSSAYQVWCFTAQQVVTARAGALLEKAGITPERILAIPTPFNSYLWRVIAVHGDRYLNLYIPLFAAPGLTTVYAHPRNLALAGCLSGNRAFERLAWFSRGYFRLDRRGKELVFSDLRMGMTPDYVFSYAIAGRIGGTMQAIPPRRLTAPPPSDEDVDWLFANIAHGATVRPAESAAWIETARLSPTPAKTAALEGCYYSPSNS